MLTQLLMIDQIAPWLVIAAVVFSFIKIRKNNKKLDTLSEESSKN